MKTEYLEKMMWEAHYYLKPNTSFSYMHSDFFELVKIEDGKEREAHKIQLIEAKASSGGMLLPIRLSFMNPEMANISHTGRGLKKSVKLMKGYFTKPEKSPYKLFDTCECKVHTSIWPIDGYKTLFYGTIGITLKEGEGVKDNMDLIIFHTSNWQKVDVYIFKGLYRPNDIANLHEVAEFVKGIINK